MDQIAKGYLPASRAFVAVVFGTLAACANYDRHAAPSARIQHPGFDERRLDAITRILQADIDAKRFPGAVLLVARDGKSVFERQIGVRDPASDAPMTQDSIFRLYSMSKPIVSVGAMILVEEGQLDLRAPVSRYLPEFRDQRVAVDTGGGDPDGVLGSVPSKRQMTVRDLLIHTSGLTYPGVDSPVAKEYLKIGIGEPVPGAGWKGIEGGDDLIQKLSRVPLAYEPGTTWQYGFSTDVLGVIIERVSGKSLDAYLAERIFKPLGMVDTGFWVEPAKHGRMAQPFAINPDNNQAIRLWDMGTRPRFLGGGGGLTSTPRDYLRLCRMLMNGGQLDGVRVLSRKAVEYMTSDHLGGITGPAYFHGPGYGFGLGFAVRATSGGAAFNGSAGDYFWPGFGGTSFWVDPRERLIVVFMIQAPGQQWRYLALLRNMLYSASE